VYNPAHLVVIVKVDPAAKSIDGRSPFARISHDNSSALLVVLVQTHLQNRIFSGQAELLVNFVFNRQSMCIPAKSSFDMEAFHRPVSGNNVLDGGGEEMTIMRETCCKWRSIVECIWFAALRQLDLLLLDKRGSSSGCGVAYLALESFNLFPPLQDGFLFLWKVNRHD
jgi:hypothetical protein